MFRQSSLFIAATAIAFLASCHSCTDSANVGGQDGGNPDGGPSDGGPDGSVDGGNDGGPSNSFGVSDGGFVLDGGNGDGVRVDPDAGGITLNSLDVQLHYAWIANFTNGWVSKFDTHNGNEVARYRTVIPRDGLGNTSGPVSALRATYPSGTNSPSRTAIDLNGDVWVANRAPGLQGSVTKIANNLSSCRHRPDGGVRTSMDRNDSGTIEMVPDAGEFIDPADLSDWTQYDDCVLFSTPLGPPANGDTNNVKVRALAVSGGFEGQASAVWAGVWIEDRIYKLDVGTGQPVPVAPDAGTFVQLVFPGGDGPYGAAVDGLQRLWVVDTLNAELALIDTKNGQLINGSITPPGPGAGFDDAASYGIAIDGRRRVWLGGWSGPKAFRYDHPGLDAGVGTWARFDFPSAVSQINTNFGIGRGIAADDQGYIWMSGSYYLSGASAAQLIGFNAEDGGLWRFRLRDGGTADFIDVTDTNDHGLDTSIGVGLDSDNNIWVNNHGGSVGTAMRVSRDGGDVLVTPQQSGNLYTYSDFTGYQLKHFTQPQGTFQQDIPGCGQTTLWLTVTWTGVVPPSTSINVKFKVAPTQAALDNTSITEYGPFPSSPVDLVDAGVPRNSFARVKFILATSDPSRSPVLQSFNVTWSCPGLN